MGNVVLDASALLALVNQEPGQDIVAAVLPRSLVSAVNASELVAFTALTRGCLKMRFRMF